MDTSTLMALYRDMWLIRAFEQGLEWEFEQGNVPGMLHTGLGQEATQAALDFHLEATDAFFPDHRCHGINALAQQRHRGDGERIMAELFGRATGVCSGKGGSLHSAGPTVGNFGDNAVEGSYMASRQLDGNDIVEAWTGVGEAVEHIRSGAGPYFLEYKTWRW